MQEYEVQSIEFKIKSVYPMLRKSEKKVADYILRNKKKVSKMTMRSPAEKTEVSRPTIMRILKVRVQVRLKRCVWVRFLLRLV